jgi:H+/Cl- antiporter ClcA
MTPPTLAPDQGWESRRTTALSPPWAATGYAPRVDVVSRPSWQRARTIGQWLLVGALVGVACGLASAVFLLLLDQATTFRTAHEPIVYALPVAGLLLGLGYQRWGAPIRGGSNLVLDTLHEGSEQIPLRMAPMVLLGTLATHVFGGSAGREGTAVQMGASLADALAHRLGMGREIRRQMLCAGIAGGFGSVFGTPLAGAVFGLEVVTIGRFEITALVPALVASLVGDVVTQRLGVVHTPYPTIGHVPLDLVLALELALFGLCMALATVVFVELTHRTKKLLERHVPSLPVRMFLGGVVVVVLWRVSGTSDYLGLGVPTIVRSFSDPTLPANAFAWKLVLTSVTLAAGFLGGEVTPLFFVGAALGSVLARALGVPIELGAGVGLAAVFGAAANTPVALSIMAVEVLGVNVLPHVVIVTGIAFLLSGHRGIYPSQRVWRRKGGGLVARLVPLRELNAPPSRPPSPARSP